MWNLAPVTRLLASRLRINQALGCHSSSMAGPDPENVSRLVALLALENMEGVGRVTARKVLDQFGSLAGIRRFPREQILNRLHRVPQVSQLIDRLEDNEFVAEAVAKAEQVVKELERRQVAALTSEDAVWPAAFESLPASHQPNVLYSYGNTALLAEPSVAFIGSAPVEPEPFEAAQTLVRRLAGEGAILSCSASDGLDNVILKISLDANALPVMIAGCGLAKVAGGLRSSVSAAVKSGGLLASSFAMGHGPFDHDVRERALVQAALAKALVFIDPQPGGFTWDALEWGLEQDRPVFALGGSSLPDRVHVIRDEIDMDWVSAALRHVPE